MQTRALGTTGLEISVAGFGAWALGGGDWEWGWGPQDDADSIAAINRAVELGVNWIDTAPIYGFGRSEEIVGRAIGKMSEKPLVFTKCGLEGRNGSGVNRLKAATIERQCEDSLRRLGVEAIDLYQIHWPIPDEDLEEGWAACVALLVAGKVRHIGVSNFSVEQLRRANALATIETLQPPYSLINREIEAEILPYCIAEAIGVIVYSPMASGLLTGTFSAERVASLPEHDFRSHAPHFQEPQLSRNLAAAERLREVGERHGVSAGATAIAWALREPVVSGAIVGFRNAEQVDGILPAAGELALSAEEIAFVEG
ncbi:MAG: aldo/keto reductase [Gaiellaceae bacterium]|jgi:aryl-alcohol dehydrogenase-like predicted oxidoreductase